MGGGASSVMFDAMADNYNLSLEKRKKIRATAAEMTKKGYDDDRMHKLLSKAMQDAAAEDACENLNPSGVKSSPTRTPFTLPVMKTTRDPNARRGSTGGHVGTLPQLKQLPDVAEADAAAEGGAEVEVEIPKFVRRKSESSFHEMKKSGKVADIGMMPPKKDFVAKWKNVLKRVTLQHMVMRISSQLGAHFANHNRDRMHTHADRSDLIFSGIQLMSLYGNTQDNRELHLHLIDDPEINFSTTANGPIIEVVIFKVADANGPMLESAFDARLFFGIRSLEELLATEIQQEITEFKSFITSKTHKLTAKVNADVDKRLSRQTIIQYLLANLEGEQQEIDAAGDAHSRYGLKSTGNDMGQLLERQLGASVDNKSTTNSPAAPRKRSLPDVSPAISAEEYTLHSQLADVNNYQDKYILSKADSISLLGDVA